MTITHTHIYISLYMQMLYINLFPWFFYIYLSISQTFFPQIVFLLPFKFCRSYRLCQALLGHNSNILSAAKRLLVSEGRQICKNELQCSLQNTPTELLSLYGVISRSSGRKQKQKRSIFCEKIILTFIQVFLRICNFCDVFCILCMWKLLFREEQERATVWCFILNVSLLEGSRWRYGCDVPQDCTLLYHFTSLATTIIVLWWHCGYDTRML